MSSRREEVRRTVWTIEHADVPVASIRRAAALAVAWRPLSRKMHWSQMCSMSPTRKRAAGVAAETTERKGGFAAKIVRYIEATTNAM